MNGFFNWVTKNVSNIFSLIGIVLTLYFGIYYVPEWLKDAQSQKEINAQENLIQSIKELVYADTLCTFGEIDLLIKAKEQQLGRSYPLKSEQVLIAAQEAFMQDKFLPLSKRKALISEIELLKKQISKIQEPRLSKKKEGSNTIYGVLSIIFSLLLVGIGVVSLYRKSKEEKDKQEEIENQLIETEPTKEEAGRTIDLASKYEEEILQEIRNFPGVEIQSLNVGEDFDFKFLHKGRLYYVEVKYLSKNKLGLKSLYPFMIRQKGLEGSFWYIYNTDITPMVSKEVSHINKITQLGRKIEFINAESALVLKRKLPTLLNG